MDSYSTFIVKSRYIRVLSELLFKSRSKSSPATPRRFPVDEMVSEDCLFVSTSRVIRECELMSVELILSTL
ncbi:hypothetical protein Micbo1qcDRAFT_169459 [Microdochium bolleyi]|uniref:Uncharacterized protein n=1 Tax=Microdochium bolleyi TaxID=196109 RepID=A0A136IK94_9PEZI|nr:hypothetical protein Micbo1qcDRAFT_169459 [Microdochium bolleyi]